MPEKSGFFDSTADDPREYAARDFAEYFARFVTNGVFNAGQYLNVSASGSDANVSLSTGFAWINGYVYSVYDSALTLPIQPATTQDRIDRVILRLDTSVQTRKIRALVVQGLPSASPTPPALNRSGSIFDLSLAQVRVVANSSIILPGNITDERLDQNVCGLVNSLIRVDTAKFQKDWDDFIASVQNQGFATPAYVNQRVSVGNYGATTNSSNAYSVTLNPAPTALVEGLRVTVKINVANTGASTLNVNGLGAKAIKKANGNDVVSGNLKANGVYTLIYDGASAFILQGEGGGGSALATEIRSGKTATTDSGDVTGTFSVAAGDYPKDVSVFGVPGLLERLTTADRNAIIAAIVAKGVAAGSSDTNAQLATKIGQISTGSRIAFTQTESRSAGGTYYKDIFVVPAGKVFTYLSDGSGGSVSNSYLNAYTGSLATNNENVQVGLTIRIPGVTETTFSSAYSTSGNGTSSVNINSLEIDTVLMRYRYSNGSSSGLGLWQTFAASPGPLTISIRFSIYNPNGWGQNIVIGEYRMYGTGILV
ncbi:hypothetical protein [Paenibacillus cineris]|uniref:Uncharacterized protein n=1 Tax=Paenibacillus cineris TaxID=237530 RepID=A0ABQ4LPG9_9BACL|nr:hypothetical protein [Paenibacillus cineris]GIO57928.1 hypothetical protein J21TS7_62460 [Paenibacillus cineris]